MIRRLLSAIRCPPSGASYGTEAAPLGMPSVGFVIYYHSFGSIQHVGTDEDTPLLSCEQIHHGCHEMMFSWISVGGNGGRRRNCEREIQLKRREMAFPWISVGGNYGMRRNHGREIQLKRREMAFSWISVRGNDMVRRDWGMLQ